MHICAKIIIACNKVSCMSYKLHRNCICQNEKMDKLSKISENDIIDVRGRRNFYGAGRGGMMGKRQDRGRF